MLNSNFIFLMPALGLWRLKKLRFHVDLAEFRHTAAQLKERLHPVQDAHVRKANLPDELQLGMLG